MRTKGGYVYILLCADETFYTGVTTNVEKRVLEHQLGVYEGYTHDRRPVSLVFTQEFPDIMSAITAEKQIKGWSHDKKLALIHGKYNLLRELARSHSQCTDHKQC